MLLSVSGTAIKTAGAVRSLLQTPISFSTLSCSRALFPTSGNFRTRVVHSSLSAWVPPVSSTTATRATATSAGTTSPMDPQAQQVLDFWLGEGWQSAGVGDMRAERKVIWFRGGAEIDAEITQRFGRLAEAYVAGQLDGWQAQPLSALAGVILGDQLTRNIYRGSARMYQADPKALAWAKALAADGSAYASLKPIQRVWVAMPFMHSENVADQNECVRLFEELRQDAEARGLANVAKDAEGFVTYADSHRKVVEQWGRFPHRNALLGRESTPEEAAGIAAGTIPKW